MANTRTKPSMSVLNESSNVNIGHAGFNNVGGDQVRIYHHPVNTGTDRLYEAIKGVGASHNSQKRFPQPRCHPGTRERVIDIISGWLDSESRDLPVCWLSGPAGVGKSAIAQTIAEIRQHEGLVASFFFFRSDPKRNIPDYLMLTIAHGLAINVSGLRPTINWIVEKNPSILEADLTTQFTELVINPLLAQQSYSDGGCRLSESTPANLVIIDGLDECATEVKQTHILRILASELAKNSYLPFPLRFLICSRPERWIREVFDSQPLGEFSKHITLDSSFSPNEDIERYLRDGFREIRESPKYSQVKFPVSWPTDDDIRALVAKARGQFIYAATVLRFIRDGPSTR